MHYAKLTEYMLIRHFKLTWNILMKYFGSIITQLCSFSSTKP